MRLKTRLVSAIEVLVPPLPVKIPSPPVLSVAKKATVSSSFMRGLPKLLKTLLMSIFVVLYSVVVELPSLVRILTSKPLTLPEKAIVPLLLMEGTVPTSIEKYRNRFQAAKSHFGQTAIPSTPSANALGATFLTMLYAPLTSALIFLPSDARNRPR